jgi:hypothetical protein
MGDHFSMVTLADVIDFFGDRQIGDHCGATVSNYGDLCPAPLDVICEGVRTYYDLRALLYAQKREGRADA